MSRPNQTVIAFENNDQLLRFIKFGSIFEFVGYEGVRRMGYIMIRKDIYQSMLGLVYSDHHEQTLERLSTLFRDTDPSFDNLMFNVTPAHISREILGLTNAGHQLVNSLKKLINKIIEGKEPLDEHLVTGLAHYSTLLTMYSQLGKSFYPNVNRHGSMQPVHALNSIVNAAIDNRRALNMVEFGEDQAWWDF